MKKKHISGLESTQYVLSSQWFLCLNYQDDLENSNESTKT